MSNESASMTLEEFIRHAPKTAQHKILGCLRYPELQALCSTYPSLEDLCCDEFRLVDHQFSKKRFFHWNRCTNEEGRDNMAERQRHCMVHYPLGNAIYAFGGEVISNESEQENERNVQHLFVAQNRASFNDLWKLDLVNMQWSRIMITTPPYPLPKSRASLVVWNEELILFGGFRPSLAGAPLRSLNSNVSEVHAYNPKTNTWRFVATDNEGPQLAGHSAIVTKDLMIVYGGFSRSQPHTNLHVLDLRRQHWHTVRLFDKEPLRQPFEVAMKLLKPDEPFFPLMNPTKTHLVLIRDGLLLITGEMICVDYGSSILIQFDPERPEHGNWSWKWVEVVGRWWSPRTFRDSEGELEVNGECSLPNSKFHAIAVIRSEKTVRLVSLGRLQGDGHMMRTNHTIMYDACQRRCAAFLRVAKEHLEKGIMSYTRTEEDPDQLGTTIEFEGITCDLEKCYLTQAAFDRALRMNAEMRPRTSERCRIYLRSESHPNWSQASLDEVDLWELKIQLKAVISQLHAKHYASRVEEINLRLPLRNRSLRRFGIYTADIDFEQENLFETMDKIRWEPQPVQFRAAPETQEYCLVGANNEVVMHGGRVELNDSVMVMGHTYLLTQAVRAPSAFRLSSSSSSNFSISNSDSES